MSPSRLLLALFVAFVFAGCAGNAVDRDFRSKVKSDTTTVSGNYDPVTKGTTGELSNTIEFRDPSKDQ